MLPSKPVYGAMAVAASMTIGMLVAMFDYPLKFAFPFHNENVFTWWTLVEFLACTLQPLLLVYGMTFVRLNMTFWGNATLAVYVFHFHFYVFMRPLIVWVPIYMQWDSTGLLNAGIILLLCFLLQTVVGYCGVFYTQITSESYRESSPGSPHMCSLRLKTFIGGLLFVSEYWWGAFSVQCTQCNN